MYQRDWGFEIFGQKFTLGTERLVFDTMVPTIDETRPDGSPEVGFVTWHSGTTIRTSRALGNPVTGASLVRIGEAAGGLPR